MGKYDFDLDMYSDNSNSIILRNITPNSKILEIGCAYGRMTKFLKENLNCYVCICEIDSEAGNVAKQWADKSFLSKEGNIESDFIFNKLESSDKFDYIIFADILEHLYNPEKVLNRIKNLLNYNGSVWISIPNIAHNSILIELWNNRFEYNETGLLDNTHIRFFTEKSLRKMVERSGFKITEEFNLRNSIENTEFKSSFNDVPKEIIDSLKAREFADVYQFVWRLEL